MDSLINKSSKVTRKQREQSDFAMFDNTTYKWDPKLTDEWLADRIVLCAKELAIADKKNETEAPLYYDRVKALTDLGRDEEKFITCCVSLE